MKLKTYLEFKQIPVKEAAMQLKIARGYMHEILSEKRPPGRKLAQRIIDWSGGAVTYQDLWKDAAN